ncbi:1183_t:CDS:2 [Diversispora eburnea]|uniref:1183_t:CDS:1 n=1 Tax=Diversispora eburnea TaxID=1213867 RepID=A0A9N9F3Y0_9GLOM|nr:1183_t:CDS:2 [Diversispora eburnea]
MRLVDTRFKGIAKGVGTAKIIGRVHSADIRVGEDMYLAFELLFGLDMLRRHQACIDLKKDMLIINGKEIPFLPEHELPEDARNDETSPIIMSPSNSVSPAVASATSHSDLASSLNHASSLNLPPSNLPPSNLPPSNLPPSNLPPLNLAPPSQSSRGINNNSPSPQVTQSQYSEADISSLASMGISRADAIKLLDAANGNVEMAASLYFG